MQYRSRFSGLELKDDMVILADCYFELYVIIGKEARDRRSAIRSSLVFAQVRSISIIALYQLLMLRDRNSQDLYQQNVRSLIPYT